MATSHERKVIRISATIRGTMIMTGLPDICPHAQSYL